MSKGTKILLGVAGLAGVAWYMVRAQRRQTPTGADVADTSFYNKPSVYDQLSNAPTTVYYDNPPSSFDHLLSIMGRV